MTSPIQRVFVTGATGFVGRSLCLRLAREGYQVVAWVRSPERARAQLGSGPELLALADGDGALQAALSTCDAVVHLAGENLFGGRWTTGRKRALVDSRVALTERLVAVLGRCEPRPRVLVGASAIGFYGDRGEQRLDESSAPGDDFLADLCQRWESAGQAATALGLRVSHLRLGLVLGAEGGALARMLTPFRLGLGGPLGSGRQYMSWIQLDDLLELFVCALTDERYSGAIDATAPEPLRNADFTRALGRALGCPVLLPAPAFALRLALGESAGVLLASQIVLPVRALELGFRFRFPDIRSALDAELGDSQVPCLGPAREIPNTPYLQERPPSHLLEQVTLLEAPIEEVFDFFSRPENLGSMTPPSMSFEIRTPGPIEPRVGAQIDYRIHLGPIPMGWRTRFDAWEPGRRFVDVQLSGPYRSWHHEHSFEAVGERTRMRDRVWYTVPFGPLGRLLNALFVAGQLRGLFAFRARAIARRFGAPAAGSAAPRIPGVRPARALSPSA